MVKRIFLLSLVTIWLGTVEGFAQIDARLLQYPDVSETQITFVYAGDIWVVPKTGGTAVKLSSPAGSEAFPKFSNNGESIAFSGNYDGNTDVYVIPVTGGIPKRLTYHGMNDRVVGWHPGENKVLFASSRESGKQRFNQFYLISTDGGLAEKLSLPYAEYGTFSPDGNKIVFTDKSRLTRTWKRYRGGMAPDLILFDFENLESEFLTETDANEELPMWHNDKLYFASDKGPEKRFNIWSYDMSTREEKQITSFSEYDIHWPSQGPGDIVFEAGGKLYLLNLSNEQYDVVDIKVVTDLMSLKPKSEQVSSNIWGGSISPDGNRAVINARGELFSVPAEYGFIKNLSQTSDIAERYPAWSPDGKFIAYWSDRSGEYELTLLDMKSGTEKKLTSYGPGYRYEIFWSPDSKKISFIDQTMKIWVYNLENNQTTQVDQALWKTHGALVGFEVSWSSDSRWMAYSRGMENRAGAIFIFDTQNGIRHQVTSGFYSDTNPCFDPDGKYLYLTTNRNFSPVYSDFGNEFIYPNSTHIAAVSLRKDVESPLKPRNDEVKKEEKKDSEGDKENKKKKNKEEAEEEEEEKPVEIDINGFESRMVILPPKPGNYNNIKAVSGKVVYHHFPNSGSAEEKRAVKYFDLKEREEKTIIEDADGYDISADGNKMLVSNKGKMAIIDIAESQKMEKPLRTSEMEMVVDPVEEYRQIFNDAWRFERDFFYDKGMHGVDWDLMKERYGRLIEDAITRDDVNFILGELIGELNASHTYKGGGDMERAKRRNTGYLGIDWALDNGYFSIAKIIRPADWETEIRSPLDMPGVDVSTGDYVLAVNGIRLNPDEEPFAAFQGLAGKTVELTVNSEPSFNEARTIIVKLMESETRLRNLAWIENNRKRVEVATEGKAGYIYVPSTAFDGQKELVRQFTPQFNKEALIIDERFNNGGQIPDRFIELLDKKPLAYWAVRDGKDWQWPPTGHFGPKVMMINGWSGSGGDAFPDYFRKAELGPLVGSRTWGGLIGISGSPQLVDGGVVTVPTFRMYDPDGGWFEEGHGVDPDVKVREDAGKLARGTDVQLERAIEVILELLEDNPYEKPVRPEFETR